MRFFLGVGKYTSNTAVSGDMGWSQPASRQWKSVLLQWHRFVTMSKARLNCRLFSRQKCSISCKNWCYSNMVGTNRNGRNKLRFYRLFKRFFSTEDYCKLNMPFTHRAANAKFRCGVAPLKPQELEVRSLNHPYSLKTKSSQCHYYVMTP